MPAGYLEGAGDPATSVGLQQAKLRALRDANNQSQYNFRGQIGADTALANPQTAAALLALSQQNAPVTAPPPGQSSAPQGQQPMGGGQPMPPVMPVTQDPSIPAPQLQQPISGGPGLSVMPGGPVPNPSSPSQIPNNPFQSGQTSQGIPGAQPMPQSPQQQPNIQQLMQQYPTPGALISAVQQANPGISGASLSRLIQNVIPMYQNRAAAQDPYKMLLEQQKLGIGAGAPDPSSVEGAVDLVKQTGNPMWLNKLTGPQKTLAMSMLKGVNVADAQVDLSGRKAQASAAGGISGRTNSAREDMAAVLSGPATRSALEYLPDDANALSGYARNTFKNFKNSPDYKAFKAANTAAAGEITRALTGGRPNLTLEREVESQLNNATDKGAWTAVANSYIESGGAAAKASQKVTSQGGISDTDTESIKLPGNAPSEDGWSIEHVR